MEIFAGLRDALRRFISSTAPYEKSVEEFVRDLQRELIRGDVNVRLVMELSDRLRKRALQEIPPPGVTRRDWFVKIIYEELVKFLGGSEEPQILPEKRPYVIMLVGVQGSGKTTSAGKLAWYYKNRKMKVGLVQTDTHRPAAYEQLKQIAERLGVEFYGSKDGKSPIELAEEGLRNMIEKKVDVVIVDTAGRHGYGSEAALLDEMKRLADAIKPDEIMLVLDATIGQKARDLAERFHAAAPVGSIFLTKLDGSARGGGALSAVAVTGARVKFVGTGEKLEDIEVFKPTRFVGRLLGMGDIEGLLERLSSLEETEELEEQAREMLSGRLDMRLVYRQLYEIRRMGPLGKILKMIPGLDLASISEESMKMSEKKLDKWLAAIQSMTYEELEKPELLIREKSRLRRVAFGSGLKPEEVQELLKYYAQMRRALKQLKRRRELLKRFRLGGQ
ncbi:MAG: signal recognition particle protein Srp54 [Fervidicoccaceae archaeon]